MVGPFDPVASKLGQQNERKGASAAENLRAKDRNRVLVLTVVAWQRQRSILVLPVLPHGHWGKGCSPLLSAKRETKL